MRVEAVAAHHGDGDEVNVIALRLVYFYHWEALIKGLGGKWISFPLSNAIRTHRMDVIGSEMRAPRAVMWGCGGAR